MSSSPNKNRSEGPSKNKRGNSFQNGAKDKGHGSNGRGSQMRGKKTTPPSTRPTESPKVAPSSGTPKPVQPTNPENTTLPKQPTSTTNIPTPSTTTNPEIAPVPALRPPITNPVVQPQPAHPSSVKIPPRTHSAPPNLQEQEKQGPLFFPDKTPSIPFKPYYTPYYGSFPMAPGIASSMGLPPNIPQPGYSMGPSNPNPPPPRAKPKIIPIIDPNTLEEVSPSSPPKSRPAPSNPTPTLLTNKQPARNPSASSSPGGIMLELSNLDVSPPPTVTPTPSTSSPRIIPIMDPPEESTEDEESKKEKKPTPEISGKKQEYQAKSPIQKSEETKEQTKEQPKEQTVETPKDSSLVEKIAIKEVQPQEEEEEEEGGEEGEEGAEEGEEGEEEEGEEEGTKSGESAEEEDQTTNVQELILPKKKKKKDVLKQAEVGNYKALTFDAYSNAPPKETNVDKEQQQNKTTTTPPSQPPPEPEKQEDEDDWENKDENELMKLRSASPLFPGGVDENKSRLSINIKPELYYPNDVWRPDNTSGKKVYDRQFLLQFQALCVERPLKLPDMAEVLGLEGGEPKDAKSNEKWQRSQPGTPVQGRGFRDGRARSGDASRTSGPPPGFSPIAPRNTRGGLQNPQGNRGRLKKGQRQNSIPEITLVATPGRWEPSMRTKEENDNHKLVIKNVTGVLNKLTLGKFEQLSDEIVNVGAINEEILKDIIKLVFDKALIEPKFSSMYADLCKKLSVSPNFSLGDKAQTFKRVLLNRCQEEFESSFKGSRKDLSNIPNISQEERAHLEEQLTLEKKKMLGNITFIGELYKIGMLTEKIMHECITKLLGDIKNPSHDDIEALCRLMTSIGVKIDHAKAKNYLDQYFTRMKELSKNKSLPSRIRFMLQDVIELRNQKWVITKDNNSLNVSKGSDTKSSTPSTVRTPREERRTPVTPQISSIATKSSNNPPNNPSSLRTSGEWEQVGTKSKRGSQKISHDDVRLQPSNMGSSLSHGAKGWKQESSSSSSSSSSSDYSNSKSSTSKNVPVENVPVESKPLPVTPPPTVNTEELESKTDLLLKEYLSCQDTAEAIMCIKELDSQSYYPNIVNRAINMTLEMSPEEREMMSKLFSAMQEDGLMTSEIFQKGVEMTLDIMEDLIIDIPNASTALCTFVADAIVDEYFPMSLLEPLFRRFVEPVSEIQAADLAADVFATIVEETSFVRVRELIRKSKFDLTNLLPSKQRDVKHLCNFLASKELKDLMPHITYGSDVEKMIKEQASGQTILKWLENVSVETRSDVTFCRYFVRWTIQSMIAGNTTIMEEYAPSLKLLLSSNFLQLNCLYEVQMLNVNENSLKGLIERIFEYLYSLKIVEAEAFIMWEEDEGVTEGKKEALEQTNKWLNKLNKKIEEED